MWPPGGVGNWTAYVASGWSGGLRRICGPRVGWGGVGDHEGYVASGWGGLLGRMWPQGRVGD